MRFGPSSCVSLLRRPGKRRFGPSLRSRLGWNSCRQGFSFPCRAGRSARLEGAIPIPIPSATVFILRAPSLLTFPARLPVRGRGTRRRPRRRKGALRGHRENEAPPKRGSTAGCSRLEEPRRDDGRAAKRKPRFVSGAFLACRGPMSNTGMHSGEKCKNGAEMVRKAA